MDALSIAVVVLIVAVVVVAGIYIVRPEKN
jgi:hypothetical protein